MHRCALIDNLFTNALHSPFVNIQHPTRCSYNTRDWGQVGWTLALCLSGKLATADVIAVGQCLKNWFSISISPKSPPDRLSCATNKPPRAGRWLIHVFHVLFSLGIVPSWAPFLSELNPLQNWEYDEHFVIGARQIWSALTWDGCRHSWDRSDEIKYRNHRQ